MVKVRLARGGVNKKPFYSIVVTDSRKRRDSCYIERIGYFNPVARGKETRLELNVDKLNGWLNDIGAQMSDRVKDLLKEYKNPAIRERQLASKVKAKVLKKAAKAAKVTEIASNTKPAV